MARLTKQEARNILAECDIPAGTDFYTLSFETVGNLSRWADSHKYRKPKSANGCRARYFYAYVARTAKLDR